MTWAHPQTKNSATVFLIFWFIWQGPVLLSGSAAIPLGDHREICGVGLVVQDNLWEEDTTSM